MPLIPVVQNPRRRRGSLSAKQLRAGFGGRARMTTGRKRGRRRRNPPILAALSNPRRKRRSVLGRNYYVAHDVRRRRNPNLFKGFDLMAGVWVGVGAIGSTAIPGLVRRFLPQIPYTGPIVYAVRLGGTAATAFAVKLITKDRRAPSLVWAGGIALVLVDLFRQHLAPRLGLSGLGQDGDFVLTEELEDAIPAGDVAGYVDVSDESVAGYVDTDFDPAIMS